MIVTSHKREFFRSFIFVLFVYISTLLESWTIDKTKTNRSLCCYYDQSADMTSPNFPEDQKLLREEMRKCQPEEN